jgi:hypothetical protein
VSSAANSGGTALGRPFPPGVSGNPSGRPKQTEEQRRALEILNAATPRAARRLVKLLRSFDEKVALAASMALLNRVLGKDPIALESEATKARLTAEAALAIVKAANGATNH